ncbi:hypothetical protein GMMP15_1860020 [Candidatus Magnetomoraceae bacterium gMMP-15]
MFFLNNEHPVKIKININTKIHADIFLLDKVVFICNPFKKLFTIL